MLTVRIYSYIRENLHSKFAHIQKPLILQLVLLNDTPQKPDRIIFKNQDIYICLIKSKTQYSNTLIVLFFHTSYTEYTFVIDSVFLYLIPEIVLILGFFQ
jgi:hypothetical protein